MNKFSHRRRSRKRVTLQPLPKLLPCVGNHLRAPIEPLKQTANRFLVEMIELRQVICKPVVIVMPYEFENGQLPDFRKLHLAPHRFDPEIKFLDLPVK